MPEETMILRSLEDAARELARAHREDDPDTVAVYLAPDPDGREIRLVEVTDSVDTSGEVLPFRFEAQPGKGIPYPVVVVLLSPEEWRQIENGQLELPKSWGPPGEFQSL